MSYQRLERRPASWWRTRAATIGDMIDQGWVVWSVCGSCFLVMRVELQVIELMMGDHETLWNRQPHCRRLGCEGMTRFHGVPPETNQCMVLTAEWPPEWKDAPPPPKTRVPINQRCPPLTEPRTPAGSVRFARRPDGTSGGDRR